MLKLLLVDDDEELCAELKELLEKEGFELDAVYDGPAGLLLLQNKKYDLLVLDLKLPGLNGYEVLKRARVMARPLKILVLSGRPMGEALLKEKGVTQDEEQKVLSLADFVINKPFIIDEFVQKVKLLSGFKVEKSK